MLGGLSSNIKKVVMLSSVGVDRREDLMLKLRHFTLKNLLSDLDVKVRNLGREMGGRALSTQAPSSLVKGTCPTLDS